MDGDLLLVDCFYYDRHRLITVRVSDSTTHSLSSSSASSISHPYTWSRFSVTQVTNQPLENLSYKPSHRRQVTSPSNKLLENVSLTLSLMPAHTVAEGSDARQSWRDTYVFIREKNLTTVSTVIIGSIRNHISTGIVWKIMQINLLWLREYLERSSVVEVHCWSFDTCIDLGCNRRSFCRHFSKDEVSSWL
jgi:hypothetical protein